MSGIFKIDGNDLKINSSAVKLIPELAGLTMKEMKYVIMVVDYVDGPYWRLPFEERKRSAKVLLWGDEKYSPESKNKSLKKAMEAYNGLVFDIKRETIDEYKKKITILHKALFREDVDERQIKNIDQSISFLQKRIDDIEKDIEAQEDLDLTIKGKKKLSFIETWQRNMQKHKEFIKS